MRIQSAAKLHHWVLFNFRFSIWPFYLPHFIFFNSFLILLTFSSIFPYLSLSSLMLITAVLKSLSVCLLQYLDPLGSASISYFVCSWSNTFPAPLSNDFWSCANICGWNILDAYIFVCLLCFFLRGTVDFLLSSVRLPTGHLDPPRLVSGFITMSLF